MKPIIPIIKSTLREYGFIQLMKVCVYSIHKRALRLKYIVLSKFFSDGYVITVCHFYTKNDLKHRIDNINWGDDVSLVLPQLISGKKTFPSAFIHNNKVNYACIGSILSYNTLIRPNTICWGAGVIASTILETKPQKVLAVRGPLTREVLLNNEVDCPAVYGDPALLFPMYYTPSEIKTKYKIGFVLHHNDIGTKEAVSLINIYCKCSDTLLIDIQNYKKWNYFIDKICQCEFILSSSLHGIIIADAYGIPNCWTEFSYKHPENGFKFRDYFLSVNKDIEEPYRMKGNETLQELYAKKNEWKSPQIDLNPLMECCPFK